MRLQVKIRSLHLLVSFLIFGCLSAYSQIQTNEHPPSFLESNLSDRKLIPLIQVPKPLLSKLQKEDLKEDKIKEIPWRFGVEEKVNKEVMKDAVWEEMKDGRSRMMLEISASGAKSINLNFSHFQLASSTKLFLYNDDYSDVLGALSAANNKENKLFSTRPIQGDHLFLELTCSPEDKNKNKLFIEGIVYGYRDLKAKAAKAFNSSGNCNVNINCASGANWQDIKRSAVMLLTASNTRFCSGALVNNVRQNGRALLLTAAHCGAAANSIFIFNYESSACSPSQDGLLTKSISGASPLAGSNNSDFRLFELSSVPPSSYGVFYAGWDASNQAKNNSTVIHHPSGDVMKISKDQQAPISSGYYSQSGSTHWTITNWEEGTTESGSSGAPLFNSFQRIIGQLHGGEAACGNKGMDYFGKFSVSWNALADSSKQLKYWLDPDNTGTLTLDAFDPSPAALSADIGLIGIDDSSFYLCADSSISPKIIAKNYGNDSIQSIVLSIYLSGQFHSNFTWNGVLLRNEVISIAIPSITLAAGKHELKVALNSSIPVDLKASNDSLSAIYVINPFPTYYNLTLKTDDYGDETTWAIFEPGQSTQIASGGPYPNLIGGAVYNYSLCLYDSCLNFVLYDNFADGFNDPSGTFGNGYALITNANSDTVVFENNFSSAQKSNSFCVSQPGTSIEEFEEKISLKLYPNPLNSPKILTIDSEEAVFYKVYTIRGRFILEGNNKNSKQTRLELNAGLYLLQFRDENGILLGSKKLLVQ